MLQTIISSIHKPWVPHALSLGNSFAALAWIKQKFHGNGCMITRCKHTLEEGKIKVGETGGDVLLEKQALQRLLRSNGCFMDDKSAIYVAIKCLPADFASEKVIWTIMSFES